MSKGFRNTQFNSEDFINYIDLFREHASFVGVFLKYISSSFVLNLFIDIFFND